MTIDVSEDQLDGNDVPEILMVGRARQLEAVRAGDAEDGEAGVHGQVLGDDEIPLVHPVGLGVEHAPGTQGHALHVGKVAVGCDERHHVA